GLVIPLARSAGEPRLARAATLKSEGRLAAARELLDEIAASASGSTLARALGMRGRIALGTGDYAAMERDLERSARTARAAGLISAAIADSEARAFAHVRYTHDLEAASRALAAAAEDAAKGDAERGAKLPYYRALLERARGDLAAALASLEDAELRAERL